MHIVHKTLQQIALIWLISQKNVAVLAKINTEKQTKEITDAFTVKITEEDLEKLTLSN